MISIWLEWEIENIVSAFNSEFSVESNIDLFDQIKKKCLMAKREQEERAIKWKTTFSSLKNVFTALQKGDIYDIF